MIGFPRRAAISCLTIGWLLFNLSHVAAQGQDYERAPINYGTSLPDDSITRLQAELDTGAVRLEHAEQTGYLKSLLHKLDIPISSQMLVYSKTSLQRQRITPKTPRAIYFNDDTYIGYCLHGPVLELSTADPKLGAVFYTLDQEAVDKPHFVRQPDNCLICHSSSNTQEIPGHLVRSLFVDHQGLPVAGLGSYRTDQSSPISQRWGGWYVTGTHGPQTHLGNMIVTEKTEREPIDNSAGHNVSDLSDRFPTAGYLTAHSDLIALMVLEHQTAAHNRLTHASFQTRSALHTEALLNKELKEPADHRWASTTTRIKSSGDALVKYLLFSGEAPLTAKMSGSTTYAQEFSSRGPRDSQGRSLRDFDLQTRLFKYPCSYLIYSPAFDALPRESKEYVLRRIWEVLTGADQSKDFAHLSPADRTAILEIVRATKPGLPDYWQP